MFSIIRSTGSKTEQSPLKYFIGLSLEYMYLYLALT
nr:MAG TPA: hypothetical protein [Bacteriophage sp.]